MDLTEAEGLADLIDAETEAQRRIASRLMAGELGRVADQWREKLIDCLARSEAVLDFSDEADVIEERAFRSVATDLSALRDEMEHALQTAERGERLRDGLLVLIAGPPNAGKSSLLDHLARRRGRADGGDDLGLVVRQLHGSGSSDTFGAAARRPEADV